MPTRFHTNSSPSLIDHVYSTSPERLEVENVPFGTSDHNLVGIRRKNGAAVDRPRMMKKRVFHNFSQEEFRKEVEKEDWDKIVEIVDLNEAAEKFNSKLGGILDKLCPLKLIQIRKNYTPWKDEKIKRAEAVLNIAKAVANKSEAIDDRRRVHQIGADVKRMYRAAEENWRKKRVEKHSRNPRKSWRQLKEWIGWTGGGAPKQLIYADGSITNSPKKIADMMVNYYSQKVKNIQKENPCSGDPLERVREMMRGKECVFKLREVTEEEVSGAVRRMKNSSALGADKIPADLLKNQSSSERKQLLI